MNPTPDDLMDAIVNHEFTKVLRGELYVYTTPAEINDDMRPTDHDELLEKGLYPLVAPMGLDVVTAELNAALASICTDAVGVFSAHQCFYLEILREDENHSPLRIDRIGLPKVLAQRFVQLTAAVHQLEVKPGDLKLDRPYRLIRAQMQILHDDHGIDFGIDVATL